MSSTAPSTNMRVSISRSWTIHPCQMTIYQRKWSKPGLKDNAKMNAFHIKLGNGVIWCLRLGWRSGGGLLRGDILRRLHNKNIIRNLKTLVLGTWTYQGSCPRNTKTLDVKQNGVTLGYSNVDLLSRLVIILWKIDYTASKNQIKSNLS